MDSNSENTGNTNVIPYEHYLKNDVESVVPSDDSFANLEPCEPDHFTDYVSDDTLTTRIKILKEQVTMYQQRAKFELTEREQKMNWQMCAYITETNLKEEELRKEINFLKNQLDQTVNQKQEIQESVNAIKLDFQNERSKLVSDFSNFKALND